MLAGDFSAVASPACNGGVQRTLRGGFQNNRIDPAQFSRAALNLVKHLPTTTDPCGEVTYAVRTDRNEAQLLGRIDYQRSPNSIFVRRNSVRGPGFWTVDASLSKVASLGATQRVAFRVEAFNLFNTFKWGLPAVNLTSPAFGRITSMAGTPRVLQFGVRYTF